VTGRASGPQNMHHISSEVLFQTRRRKKEAAYHSSAKHLLKHTLQVEIIK